MKFTRRAWIWLGVVGLLFWTWVTMEVTYRVIYVFRITDLNVLADGIQRVPYVVAALSLVWLVVFMALRRYRQLTEKGFYIAFGALLVISGFGLWVYVDWSKAATVSLYRYELVIDSKPPGARFPHDDLGSLRHGSASGGGGVLVFPIDHTRLIRAHDRLVGRGYGVHYKDTGLAQDIMARYIFPYRDESY